MKHLTDEQATVLRAFLDAFDLQATGVWTSIEKAMRDDFGIENPEEALEDARDALQ